MKTALLTFLIIANGIMFAQTTKKVFFIGNSYTAYNNLPQLISYMANSTGNELIYQSHVPGGSNLLQHASNSSVTQIINQGDWDYVVLQQQSQMPAFPNANATFLGAQQLTNQIKQANPCGNVMFYMTWGRKFGDEVNCANGVDYMCTYEGMDDKIYERYMQMAVDNQGVVSPVGKVWRVIRETFPEIELFQSDHSHPSYIGSMVAAYTFHTALFKTDPTQITYNGNLSSSIAQQIKQIVKNVVYDNLDEWYLGINDVTSKFNTQQINANSFQFTNLSHNATTYFWDFGDGNTSVEENPVHTYLNTGNYTVQLTTNACEQTSTVSKNVAVEVLNVNNPDLLLLKLYPNPASEVLYIDGISFDTIAIYEMSGKEITVPYHTENGFTKLDTQSLTIGTYILKVTLQNQSYFYQFIKK